MKTLIASYTKKDFDINTFCTGGPGGQNQNKKQMGVRITHIPTGLSCECRETRKYEQNKKKAFIKLSNLIKEYHAARLKTEYIIETETVRTYHEADNRVTDHKSGLKQSYKEATNDLTTMIEARRKV